MQPNSPKGRKEAAMNTENAPSPSFFNKLHETAPDAILICECNGNVALANFRAYS